MEQRQIKSVKWCAFILAIASAASSTSNVRAETNQFYERKAQGWFWREKPPGPLVPPTAETPPPPADSVPPILELKPFSPAWLREKLPEFRDKALENPSPENVRAYYYLQKYAMDVAERFSLVAQRVVMADPTLDENTRRPNSTYGAHVYDEVARRETERLARKIATVAGVWYFYRSDCPYCQAQNPILERLQDRIGLAVLPIALDGKPMPEAHFARYVPDRGHAEQLKVTQSPTLFLVRKSDKFILLGEGLLTDEALLDRIVLAAHEAGWITDEEFNMTRPRKPVDPGIEASTIADDTSDEAIRLVELLRTKIEQ